MNVEKISAELRALLLEHFDSTISQSTFIHAKLTRIGFLFLIFFDRKEDTIL